MDFFSEKYLVVLTLNRKSTLSLDNKTHVLLGCGVLFISSSLFLGANSISHVVFSFKTISHVVLSFTQISRAVLDVKKFLELLLATCAARGRKLSK